MAKAVVKKAPVGASVDALLDRMKALLPHMPSEVISRRLENPNDPGSLPIFLKDEDPNACVNSDHMWRLKAGATTCHLCSRPARKWVVRWFNLAQEGRNAQMRAKLYTQVEVAELREADDIADIYRSKDDTYVRRGDKGQEILCKQPLELFSLIKRKQRDLRNSQANSRAHLRATLADAAGTELGDEMGSMIHDGDIRVESMTRSKTTWGEELPSGE